MDSFIFDLTETYDYENIFFCQEKTLGLKAIIVIHSMAGVASCSLRASLDLGKTRPGRAAPVVDFWRRGGSGRSQRIARSASR